MNFTKTFFISYVILQLFLTPGKLVAQKELDYTDKKYEDNIKTVILYRADDLKGTPLNPAAIPIFQRIPLMLKFDEIKTNDADYYRAKIIHCDLNWKPSGLSDLQFLNEYNEFPIDQFEFSIATKVPYTHFTFQVPRVKLPSNYLLVVYRETDEGDIILSKRFIVYDPRAKVVNESGFTSAIVQRRNTQQIHFSIDYTGLNIPNPLLDLKLIIRQNHRWDNAIIDLKPTMVKEDIKQIEYQHFNLENNFSPGNEFRFFDIRSTHFGGRNVEKTNISETQIDAYLYFDKSRGHEAYSNYRDLNGGFVVENSEGQDDFLESDYINVNFFLDTKGKKIDDDIYIGGKLTDWDFSSRNKMTYVEASNLYIGNLLLKQGLYDFIYYTPGNNSNPYQFEGSHFETRNEYEIIVYFSDPILNTDLIIGYALFKNYP